MIHVLSSCLYCVDKTICFVVLCCDLGYDVRHIHMISLPTVFTFASREFGNLIIVQRQLSNPDG